VLVCEHTSPHDCLSSVFYLSTPCILTRPERRLPEILELILACNSKSIATAF